MRGVWCAGDRMAAAWEGEAQRMRCAQVEAAAQVTRRTTTAQGYGWQWQRLRLQILRRDAHVCAWCGEYAGEVDHVVSKVEGGSDDPTNLVAACRRCNAARGWRVGRARARARAREAGAGAGGGAFFARRRVGVRLSGNRHRSQQIAGDRSSSQASGVLARDRSL